MWLMTVYGFFSIVCVPGGAGETPKDDLMCIRARRRSHLVKLKKRFPGLDHIHANVGADYPYRIIATRELVGQLMVDMVVDMNHSNFKDAVAEAVPEDSRYNEFLHDVWARGLGMQYA